MTPPHNIRTVLGIESTCDETAVAVVRSGHEILSHAIASQAALHAQFGGVVPELASRHHIDAIIPLLEQCCPRQMHQEIDLIAVACGPGLIGSLLVGMQTAKALAWALDRPLVGVNHVEAHLYAAMMGIEDMSPLLPAVGVILSGGHSTLLRIDGIGQYTTIGQTTDDAAGEAFDKVAKMLGLGYPGGPRVEEKARHGNPTAFVWRAGNVKGRPYHFSFSGLKTAVLYTLRHLEAQGPIEEQTICDLCASFQRTVVEDVITKIQRCCVDFHPRALFLGGGVTQNAFLREQCNARFDVPVFWPPLPLCLDNAAMIAGLGFHVWYRHPIDERQTLTPRTRISLT
jgi:N6-L-threonylcarbamoyladenine synthase